MSKAMKKDGPQLTHPEKISAESKIALNKAYEELSGLFKRTHEYINEKEARENALEVLKDYQRNGLENIKETYLHEKKGKARKIVLENLKAVNQNELTHYIAHLNKGNDMPDDPTTGGAGS